MVQNLFEDFILQAGLGTRLMYASKPGNEANVLQAGLGGDKLCVGGTFLHESETTFLHLHLLLAVKYPAQFFLYPAQFFPFPGKNDTQHSKVTPC